MSNSVSKNICQCNTGVSLLDSIPKAFFYDSGQITIISLSHLRNPHKETNHHKDLSGKNNNDVHLAALGILECGYDALRILAGWQCTITVCMLGLLEFFAMKLSFMQRYVLFVKVR